MRPDNGYNPAFPFHIKLRNKDGDSPFRENISYGLTKRELFAAMMFQSTCNTNLKDLSLGNLKELGSIDYILACNAVDKADALIKALEAPNE